MVGTFHRSGETWLYGAPGIHWGISRLTARVAVSPEAAAQAERALGGEYTMLWNGVELNRVRSTEPWPTDGPTVMFLGRDEPRKGLDVLLEAFGNLPPDARLWVVGPGTDRSESRRRYGADRRISWLGEVTNREKWRRLRGADVMCAPSLNGESFGVVLIEGMAAGTPVVASDIPGYRSVIRSGREAALFPAGHPMALAKELLSVLFDAPRRDELVVAGTECAESFSMHNLARRYLGIFEPLVDGRRSARRPRNRWGRHRMLDRRGG
jgi:phosphatidyl-myo-inositol alpha-mannosyltransferase